MYRKREDTDEKVAAILQLLATFSRGETVSHREIETVSGLSHGSPRYYVLVRRARDIYRASNGVWSREVPGVGYRLLSAEQSLTEEQSFRRRKMRRQGNIAATVAETLPDEGLSDHQKRLRQHVLESHAKTRKELLQDERHEQWLLRPIGDKSMKVRPPRTGTESA